MNQTKLKPETCNLILEDVKRLLNLKSAKGIAAFSFKVNVCNGGYTGITVNDIQEHYSPGELA